MLDTTKYKYAQIRVTHEEYKKLDEKAAKDDRTLSNWGRAILLKAIKK